MIPLRLRLRNFMSYGENVPPLDFRQVTTACLIGKNGHGKSALLEAMTWALWGQTRAKNVDDIVRLGQTEAEVEFEFDLEGQRFRIIRKRSLRTKAGQTSLELHGHDPVANRFQSISGNSVRQTEAKIIQLLHMNYDTFINSVFILQGRADEFTKRRPSERKRILSEILGLSLYDDLETRSRARRNQLDQEIRTLNLRIEELQRDVAQKDDVATAVATLQENLTQVQEALQLSQHNVETLRQRHSALELKSQRVQDVTRRLQDKHNEQLDIEQQLATYNSRIMDYDAILQQENTIITGYQNLQHVKEKEGMYGSRAQEYATLQQRLNVVQQTLTTAQHRLELERQSSCQRLHETDGKIQTYDTILQQAVRINDAYNALMTARQQDVMLSQTLQKRYALEQEKHPLERQIQQKRHALEIEQRSFIDRQKDCQQKEAAQPAYQQQIEALQKQLEDVEQQEKHLEQVRAEGVSLKLKIDVQIPQSLAGLQQEIQDQQEKSVLLETADAHCPLCEKSLTDSERQHVMRKLAQDIGVRQTQIQTLQDEQKQLQMQRERLRTTYKQLEQTVVQRKRLDQQYATTQASLDEAIRAHDELMTLHEALQQLDHQLTNGHYAVDDISNLQQLETQLANLGYNAREHESIKQQIESLMSAEAERIRLQQAETERATLQAERPSLLEQIKSLEQALQSKQYATAERQELQGIETSITRIDFHPEIYATLRQQLQEHQHFERQHLELETARKHHHEIHIALQHLADKQQRYASDIINLEQEQQAFTQEIKTIQELKDALCKAEAQIKQLRDREGDIRITLGRSQSQYEHCKQREIELQQDNAQRDQAVEERTLYGDLAQIFGKNGIQAIIIENAIPELEDDANRILSRVTDNAMHLTLETQRDTRGGNVVETLDIRISDTIGTRNYELFSGGEAFRINFALRIALSKMLARRAGARLRTLVIDEGFGTQDSEGLERLVDVIKAIKDDFAKIIVITHLSELKNAFDTHIEVKKDPLLGSSYQVL
ncbi:MAG: SMC family ATPase [bacterium]|nr:SMC family ATPase [bacterium]